MPNCSSSSTAFWLEAGAAVQIPSASQFSRVSSSRSDDSGRCAGAIDKRLAGPQLASGVSDQPPMARRIDFQKQPLPFAAGRFAHAEKAGGDDPRVVEDQPVAGPQNFGQIGDRPMFEAFAASVDDQHPRRVPPWQRLGRDQLGGKFVVVGGQIVHLLRSHLEVIDLLD